MYLRTDLLCPLAASQGGGRGSKAAPVAAAPRAERSEASGPSKSSGAEGRGDTGHFLVRDSMDMATAVEDSVVGPRGENAQQVRPGSAFGAKTQGSGSPWAARSLAPGLAGDGPLASCCGVLVETVCAW